MLSVSVIPEKLQNIPQPPTELFVMGAILESLLSRPCLTVVGSRHVSAYGKAVTTKLVSDAARAGALIVSGLAIGVDSIAHRAALDANGLTLAIMPGGLDQIYPRSHQQLARRILDQGGALVSEYPRGFTPAPWTFIARNRLVSGLGDVVLITEAGEKSGTLHTARFALEQGKDVMAVPGNITSPTSVGTNRLIQAGAMPATNSVDILNALGISGSGRQEVPKGDTPQEQTVLDLIGKGTCDGSDLLIQSRMDVGQFNQTITMLEITGKVRALGANQWSLL